MGTDMPPPPLQGWGKIRKNLAYFCMTSHPGAMAADPGDVEAHPYAMETCPRAVEDHPGTIKAFPGGMQSVLVTMEAHNT